MPIPSRVNYSVNLEDFLSVVKIGFSSGFNQTGGREFLIDFRQVFSRSKMMFDFFDSLVLFKTAIITLSVAEDAQPLS